MKTFITLFFLVILLNIFINNEEKTILVNSSKSNNEYNFYTISCNNITSNNLESILKDYKIVGIYPYINPIYKEKIAIKYYKYESIEEFKKQYFNILKELGYNREVLKYYLDGIKIEQIVVYANERDLNLLKVNCILQN